MDQRAWVVGAQCGPKSMGCGSSIWSKEHGLWVPNVDQRAWAVLVKYGLANTYVLGIIDGTYVGMCEDTGTI